MPINNQKTIVFAAAEATPIAKAGGLGDVMGSLPSAIAKLGYRVVLMMPRYGFIDPVQLGFRRFRGEFAVDAEGQLNRVGLWQGHLPQNNAVEVYLIEDLVHFGTRKTVYPFGDMAAEVGSFEFFNEAILQLLHQMDISPDVIHVNDWHTAMLATKLRQRKETVPFFANTKSVLTIHNLAYQGEWDNTNRLAQGLASADQITTVSPTYAEEIQTVEGGCGLDALLQKRAAKGELTGLLNGLDTTFYDPEQDPALPARFSVQNVSTAKTYCKAALQEELGLTKDPNLPVFAVISRLVEQKGLDILLPVLEQILPKKNSQWVILGSGDPAYEARCAALGSRFENCYVHVGFDESFARHVYGGADIFVMPSRFEPCGLGQMIAMRYGAVPVVRRTGGLNDTVIDTDIFPETGTGFVFNDYDMTGLQYGLNRALMAYKSKNRWQSIVKRAMSVDFSWHKSASAYDAVYTKLGADSLSNAPSSVLI